MNTLKLIETLKKYYTLSGLDREPTNDEKEFMRHFELHLAESMLNDFDNDFNNRLAKILLVLTEGKYNTLLDEINSINLEEIQEKCKNDKAFSLSYKYNK